MDEVLEMVERLRDDTRNQYGRDLDRRDAAALIEHLYRRIRAADEAIAAADRAIPLLAAFAGDAMDSECHGALMDWDWHQARVMPAPESAARSPAP